MSSTMAMWDVALPFWEIGASIKCKRCGRTIRNSAPNKRYCSERCRKRAERARWKARWKARGVNKYIGGRDKSGKCYEAVVRLVETIEETEDGE